MTDSHPGIMIMFVGLLFGLVVCRVGLWWYQQATYWKVGKRIELEMYVSEPVSRYFMQQSWNYQGKRVVVEYSQMLKPGDFVTFVGEVRLDKNDRKEFVGNITGIISQSRYRWWFDFQERILQSRSRLESIYKSNLSEPHSSLISGLILGKGDKMPAAFYEALTRSGTVHVVAASGYNVTLVANLMVNIFILIFKRKVAVGLSIISIGVYVVLAGSGPAVVRAGLMGSFVFVAQALGREYTAFYSLILSSAGMLLISPWLWFDVSFQLSVSATAGILCLVRPLKVWLGVKKRLLGIDNLLTTLAATLSTLPVILITFGQLSLISPLTNVLVLGLVPPLMVLGAFMLLVGLVVPSLAVGVAVLLWPILHLFITIVEISGSWSLAQISIPQVNWLIGVGWWLLLIYWHVSFLAKRPVSS